MMRQCVLIKGGDVFLSDKGTFARRDLLLEEGHIRKIGDSIAKPPDATVIDASEKLVTPGLIDFHMHAFRYGHFLSVDADAVAHSSGTTTFVDGGSAGSLHFMAFREYVIKPANANILAFLNISAIGQTTDGVSGLSFHDNDNDDLLHLPSAEEIIEKNRDIVVGVKVRAYTGLKSLLAMSRARELADRVELPIMVHLAPAPPTFQELLPYLKERDIITHPYHGGSTTMLDENGRVLPEYWEARQRGIEVDLGLDRFHGDLSIMKAAFDQGFLPDYISTDLAMTNIDSIVFDMPTTISKVVACGMPLAEAVARSTTRTARKLKIDDELGILREEAVGDVAVFELQEGDFNFVDFFGNTVHSNNRLTAIHTFRQGQVMLPPDRETETLDVLNRANPWKSYG
jgi:dihydroorotase